MSYFPGAGCDLAGLIGTRLFVVCPNNSGSSFLNVALGTCRAAWRLPWEGQFIRGFAGPVSTRAYGPEQWFPGLLWASEQRWIDLFSDPRGYDCPRTRKEYDEVLTDMNERQIARLDATEIAAFNRVFRAYQDTLGWFGYELMDPEA